MMSYISISDAVAACTVFAWRGKRKLHHLLQLVHVPRLYARSDYLGYSTWVFWLVFTMLSGSSRVIASTGSDTEKTATRTCTDREIKKVRRQDH